MSLRNTDVRTPGAAAIAKKWGLPLTKVYGLISQGAKVEFEHNRDKAKAKQVARDHINERPDYYKRLRSMERLPIRIKEESVTGGVSGLGYVSGNPAISGNYYADTNAMSYVDENGNHLEWIRNQTKGHNVLKFKEFNPTELTKVTKKKIHEGLSTEPERDTAPIGDYTGASRKVMKVDEVKIPPKVKKAVAVGMTAANIATGAQVYDHASRGVGSPIKDVAAVATGVPGKVGWSITPGHYGLKGLQKTREYIKSKQQEKKMEEQGSPANPARYTERPMYEGDAMKDAEDKIKAAFTADKVKDMFKRVDKQRDKDSKWVAYKKSKQQSIKEQLMTAKLGNRTPMDDPHTVTPSDPPGPRTPSDPPGPRTPSDPPGPITPDDSRNRNNISEMDARPLPTSRNIDDRRPGFNFQGLKQLTVDKFNKNMADRQAGDHYEFQKSKYNPNTSVKKYSDPQKPMDAAIGAVKDTVKQAGSYIKDRLGVDGKPFPSSYSAANRFNHPSYKPLQKVAQTSSQSMAASLPSGGGKTPATLGSTNTPNKNDSKPFDWDDINGEKAAEVKRQNVSNNPGPTLSAAGEGSSGGGGRSITSNPTGWNVSQGADGDKMIRDKIDSRYTRTPPTTGDETPSNAKPTSSISPKRNELNEISAELVGKVSNARFWRKEAPSKTLSRAINKKFIESGKKKEEPKKPVKEEETKKDVGLMGNQKPDAYGYGAKGTTKTIHEETTMDTKELINEALDDILENNLVSMKENLMAALQEKAMEKIEEKKKEIAANYFAQ